MEPSRRLRERWRRDRQVEQIAPIVEEIPKRLRARGGAGETDRLTKCRTPECRESSSSRYCGRRGNLPDPVAAVVGDEQPATWSNRHPHRTSPLLHLCAV